MPNLPRMNPADSHQLSHVPCMALEKKRRPPNPPPLRSVSGAHQMRMKAVPVLELTRRGHPHAFADAFVWLEFIGHKKSVENPNIPFDYEGAGNIAEGCGDVHIPLWPVAGFFESCSLSACARHEIASQRYSTHQGHNDAKNPSFPIYAPTALRIWTGIIKWLRLHLTILPRALKGRFGKVAIATSPNH